MSQLADPQIEPTPRRSFAGWILRPKVAIPLILLALLLLSPFIIRGYFLSGVPDPPEPFDSAALMSNLVPDTENAFTHYHQATALQISPSQEVSDNRDLVNVHGWALATPELAQFLHDNEDAIIEWKAGAALERAQSTDPSEYNLITALPSIQETREFARTGVALSQQLEAEGEPMAAWSCINSLLRTSRHLGTQGSMIERLVGIAIASTALERLQTWSANPALTAGDLRQALREYEAMQTISPKNSEVFQTEYLMMKRTIEMLESGELKWSEFDMEGPLSNQFLRYIRGEPELSQRLFRIYHHHLLAFVDLPPHARPPVSSRFTMLFDDTTTLTFDGHLFDAEDFATSAQRSLIFGTFAPTAHHVLSAMDRDLVMMQCGRVLLASQIFFRDRGRFPTDLEELVPDYLSKLPEDPFSGKPLLLSADPMEPVIYSVYLNNTDEGGTEFTWSQTAGTVKSHPDDLGLKLIVPGSIPLVAPKPFVPNAEEN